MKKLNTSRNLLIRINDIQYEYLKIICEHSGLTINEAVEEFIDYGLETHENLMLNELAKERLNDMKRQADMICAHETWDEDVS